MIVRCDDSWSGTAMPRRPIFPHYFLLAKNAPRISLCTALDKTDIDCIIYSLRSARTLFNPRIKVWSRETGSQNQKKERRLAWPSGPLICAVRPSIRVRARTLCPRCVVRDKDRTEAEQDGSFVGWACARWLSVRGQPWLLQVLDRSRNIQGKNCSGQRQREGGDGNKPVLDEHRTGKSMAAREEVMKTGYLPAQLLYTYITVW